ncbi:hypothetical protein WR25_00302 [Diploscapter pachys]|uniref:Uncharacterized protein n=1 Tax=Diploscapter pachys TaxID=2018661 RepID=A0A2A2J6R5_9BILA|nr:hypothetical protein WR25_00302 [Diploscapter pachys]
MASTKDAVSTTQQARKRPIVSNMEVDEKKVRLHEVHEVHDARDVNDELPSAARDGEDEVMTSLEEQHANLELIEADNNNDAPLTSDSVADECPRSDDEFAPTTSTATTATNSFTAEHSGPPANQLPQQVTPQIDAYLQEMLLSSPAHLFSCGLLSPQLLSASWEQWLCLLASNLTPQQWQGYWMAHCAVFGQQAVPFHLLSFFNQNTAQPPPAGPSNAPTFPEWSPTVDHRHAEYEIYFEYMRE